MPLRRTPLLVEAAPARKSEQGRGIGSEPLGAWSRPLSDARAATQSSIRIPKSKEWYSRSAISIPKSASRESAKGQRVAKPKIDPSFPTGMHKRVHDASPKEAHKYLDTFHAQRNKVNPDTRIWGIHGIIPGLHHSDKGVSERAWKMQAQNLANSQGGKAHFKKPEPHVVAAVVQHKKTGARETRTIRQPKGAGLLAKLSFHTALGRRRAAQKHVGPAYDVIHAVRSESITRTALLSESLPDPKQAPPIAHSRTVEARIKAHIRAGKHQLADRLKHQLRMRKELRKTLGGKQETPASGAATLTTRAQRWGRNTKQRHVSGTSTQQLRATQTMTIPPRPRKAGGTTVISTPIPKTSQTIPRKRENPRRDTERLRVQTASIALGRTPLLTELVTKAMGANPGGAFATGLKPGDPITSHPRDQRDLPTTPRKGGAVTTRDVGHTANTGAWVPDKKRRGIKIPEPEPLPSGRDPITKQFEKWQPSNTGGVLTVVRPRTRLLGG